MDTAKGAVNCRSGSARSADAQLVGEVGFGEKYQCLHPGCNSTFVEPSMLDHHIKAHFDQGIASTTDITIKQPVRAADGPTLIPDHSTAHGSILLTLPDLDEIGRHYDQLNQRVKCLAGGCKSLFQSLDDCRRHMRKHLPGPRKFECSEPGCQYKGEMGFYRRGKLICHRRNQHGLDTPRLVRGHQTPANNTAHKPPAKRLT